jgi:hypothetical protein
MSFRRASIVFEIVTSDNSYNRPIFLQTTLSIVRDDGINSPLDPFRDDNVNMHKIDGHEFGLSRTCRKPSRSADKSIAPSWLEEFVLKMRMDQARTLLVGAGRIKAIVLLESQSIQCNSVFSNFYAGLVYSNVIRHQHTALPITSSFS